MKLKLLMTIAALTAACVSYGQTALTGALQGTVTDDRMRAAVPHYQGVPIRQLFVSCNCGTSRYDGLDLAAKRRFAGRFQAEAHYVFSSSITNESDDHNGANPNEWSDIGRAETGPSDYHQRHRFVGFGIVSLPWSSQVSLVATLGSGLAVNPITGVDNNGDTTTRDRPPFFGRSSFRGTRQTSFDFSWSKLVVVSEKTRLELRADAFNVFNGSNFHRFNNVYGNGATPAATFLRPLAGVTNADPGRQFTFGARLAF
jgi:hypothetical protein